MAGGRNSRIRSHIDIFFFFFCNRSRKALGIRSSTRETAVHTTQSCVPERFSPPINRHLSALSPVILNLRACACARDDKYCSRMKKSKCSSLCFFFFRFIHAVDLGFCFGIFRARCKTYLSEYHIFSRGSGNDEEYSRNFIYSILKNNTFDCGRNFLDRPKYGVTVTQNE